MFIATSNKTKQLLWLSFIERVEPAELKHGRENIKALLADLAPGFRVLADFGRMDSMSVGCAQEIGQTMELIDRSGVGMVARVIPDPSKDIGMNILTLFHYRNHPQVITCKDMADAVKKLGL